MPSNADTSSSDNLDEPTQAAVPATDTTAEPKDTSNDVAKKPPTQETQQNGGWEKVLSEVKKEHNTLYGVLRMAQTSETDSEITLTFQFGFHKKQLDQPKNMAIIRKLIQENVSPDHKLTLLVSQSAKKPENKIPKPADDGALSNVSNIFGGAELLES